MFDFGFSELIVIAVVTLIVVGPERLPKVARTAGHLLGRLQRYISDVKSDIQREMQLEELKKLQQQVELQARELESSMRSQVQDVEADLGKTAAEVKGAVAGDSSATPAPVEEAAPVAVASGTPVQATEPSPAEQAAGEQAVDSRQLSLGLDPSPVPLNTQPADKA